MAASAARLSHTLPVALPIAGPRLGPRFLPRPHPSRSPRATFLSFPSSGSSPFPTPKPALLTASRHLPYPADTLYSIIADVDAYASFLPYCQHSRVTAWTTGGTAQQGHGGQHQQQPQQPHQNGQAQGQHWPTLADLTVGWGPITESYTSRLYCIPGRVVEAVSGKGTPSISAEEATRWGLDLEREKAAAVPGGVFDSLVTRWAVYPSSQAGGSSHWTEVELSIRYQFASAMYQLATANVADEVARMMIKVFERRARDLLGSPRL